MFYKVVSQILTERNTAIELVDSYMFETRKHESFIAERILNNSSFVLRDVIRFESLSNNVKYERRPNIGAKADLYYEDYMRSAQLNTHEYKINLKNGEVVSIYKFFGSNPYEINYRNLSMLQMMDVAKIVMSYNTYFQTTRFYSGKTLQEEYLDKLKK